MLTGALAHNSMLRPADMLHRSSGVPFDLPGVGTQGLYFITTAASLNGRWLPDSHPPAPIRPNVPIRNVMYRSQPTDSGLYEYYLCFG